MATIAMFMEWPGVTEEQYEALFEELDLDRHPAEGALLHVASFSPEGLRVMDLWESEAAFDAFSRDRMMPAVQNAGIDSEPSIEIYPAHNVYAPGLDVLAHMGASSQPEADEASDEEPSDEEDEPASTEATEEVR